MTTKVIRIGNSRGIRIPKAILEECDLEGAVELKVRRGHLIVRPASKPRRGWEETFRRMALRGDDRLLDRNMLPKTKWERTDWEW